jgi:hypothetical protein
MPYEKGRDELPDINSIIEFSKRLRIGVSSQEAKRFLRTVVADKYLPTMCDYTIVEHRNSSRIFQISEIKLYLDQRQQRERSIEGHELRELLSNQPVLNANDLEYLLGNQSDIPEDWKLLSVGKSIRTVTFWGTLYKSKRDHNLYVRNLYWGLDTDCRSWVWNSNFVWLGTLWDEYDLAVIYNIPF